MGRAAHVPITLYQGATATVVCSECRPWTVYPCPEATPAVEPVIRIQWRQPIPKQRTTRKTS